MKAKQDHGYTSLWLSADDTARWAHRWPCSQLAGRRVFAQFKPNGDLVELAIDGGRGEQDIDANELTALTSDYLRERFGASHPAIR